MFNPLLSGYGAKGLATVQTIAGGQSALPSTAGVKSPDRVDVKPPVVVDKSVLDAAVKKLNEFVAPALQTIEFSVDQDSERTVVKVIDTVTQKVLRQIPNEEVLAISKTLDKLQGLVIKQTA